MDCASFFYPVTNVQHFLDILDEIAPSALAADWDNVGLLVGNPQSRVTAVLVALDPVLALIDAAQLLAAELIITHHPAIFHPLKRLRTDQPLGSFLAAAVRAGINVIGCHTNFDAACGGVSDILAEALELVEVVPLVADQADPGCGLGRIGRLPKPLAVEDFLARLQVALPLPWLLEAGPRPEIVGKAAVCGGACSELAETALVAGADVLLTSEIKHHTARWAEETGLWLLDGGHFATENPAMRGLQQQLAKQVRQAGLNVQVHLAQQKAPLRLVLSDFFRA